MKRSSIPHFVQVIEFPPFFHFRHVSDDVMIDDLEARVRERENELQLMRRSFEDNEKALHRVRIYAHENNAFL